MSRIRRFCCEMLVLSLILSAVSCAALSEEQQEIDLQALMAPEEASVIEEAPAAEGSVEPDFKSFVLTTPAGTKV